MSPRGQHRDAIETERAQFEDPDSFVSLDGRLFLKRGDWYLQRDKALIRDGYKCQDCGVKDSWYNPITVHHIVKKSDNGSDDMQNLASLCWKCHNLRHPEKQLRWREYVNNTDTGDAGPS